MASVHKEFRLGVRWRHPAAGTSINDMTPAERESSIAFARHNLLIDGLEPSARAMGLAAAYSAGDIDEDALIKRLDAGDEAPRALKNERTADLPTDAVFVRTVLVCRHPWTASSDLDELRAIHIRLFGGLGPWAGRLRRADQISSSSKGYFPPALLNQGAASIGSGLASERNLTSLDRPDFRDRLAYYYDELGFLHPFDRGNAMTLRIFASRLAHDAGWDLDWGTVDRHAYQEATHRAYLGDLSGLMALFAAIIRPVNPTRIFLIAGWDQGPAH